jgi:hypothetical protein
MQVNLFDTIQTSRKVVFTSVFVTLTAFVDNVLSFNLESQSSRTLRLTRFSIQFVDKNTTKSFFDSSRNVSITLFSGICYCYNQSLLSFVIIG